jgi:hypothetical protein
MNIKCTLGNEYGIYYNITHCNYFESKISIAVRKAFSDTHPDKGTTE